MTTKQQQQQRETAVIRAPHDGSEVGVVALAGPEEVRAALDANVAASRACREMPAYARAAALYAQRYADSDGKIRATFEFVWMSGWAPHESQQKPLKPGSAKTKLGDALEMIRKSGSGTEK